MVCPMKDMGITSVKLLYFIWVLMIVCKFDGCAYKSSNFYSKSNSVNNGVILSRRNAFKHFRNSVLNGNRSKVGNDIFWITRVQSSVKLKKIANEVNSFEVNMKQNYQHNEASPTSPVGVLQPLSLIFSNVSNPRNTSVKTYFLDDKPFNVVGSTGVNPPYEETTTPQSTTTVKLKEKVLEELENIEEEEVEDGEEESTTTPFEEEPSTYFPFEETLTLRIGAFFEAKDIGTLSTRFLASLQEQLRMMQREYEIERLKEKNDEEEESKKFSSVFGKVVIEGLAMEAPAMNADQITRTCETLLSKNVVSAIGYGSPVSVYITSLLTQNALIPLVSVDSLRYADEEAYKVR